MISMFFAIFFFGVQRSFPLSNSHDGRWKG